MSATTTLNSTIEMIHKAHGGILPFWVATLKDEVAPPVRDTYRQIAEQLALRGEMHWLRDLSSLEEPGAKRDFDTVHEVAPCLVDAPQGELTSNFMEKCEQSVVDRVRAGILDLLEAAKVVIPAGKEVAAGSWLVKELTGRAALEQFDGHLLWLADVRHRHARHLTSGAWITARLAMIERLAPNVFAPDDRGGYRHGLSFRLFLRGRLLRVCEQKGWKCLDQRGLRSAFFSLDRVRIGEIFDHALKDWIQLDCEPWQKRSLSYLFLDRVTTS